MKLSEKMETIGEVNSENHVVYTNDEFWEVKNEVRKLEVVVEASRAVRAWLKHTDIPYPIKENLRNALVVLEDTNDGD